MVFSPKLSPVLQPKNPQEYSQEKTAGGYSVSDPSLEVLKFCNNVVDFLEGAQDHWSSKGLMRGYGEDVNVINQFVKESLSDSSPVVQATTGSAMGVSKILGAIPFGLGHWVHQSIRDTVAHDLGTGFKTAIAIPAEGFVEGGKHVLHQVARWLHGDISESTFGVADEVSTTLGTAVLMFLGIKSIHTGGTGMINGLRNVELPTPTLATATGQLMPMPVAAATEAISGAGPMAEGLIYMSADSKAPEGGSSSRSPQWDAKRFAEKAIMDDQALAALIFMAKEGDQEALAALVELAKKDPREETFNALWQTFKKIKPAKFIIPNSNLVKPTPSIIYSRTPQERVILQAIDDYRLLNWAEGIVKEAEFYFDHNSKLNPEVLQKLNEVQALTISPNQKARILDLKAATGDFEALDALGVIIRKGEISDFRLQNLWDNDRGGVLNMPIRKRAFEVFKGLPGRHKAAERMATFGMFQRMPQELGTPILDWLIQESVKHPDVAEGLINSQSKSYPINDFSRFPELWASADFSPVYSLAQRDNVYGHLLRNAYHNMTKSSAKAAELEGILNQLGIDLSRR